MAQSLRLLISIAWQIPIMIFWDLSWEGTEFWNSSALFLVSSCGIHNQVSFTLHSNEKAKDAMFYSYNKNINGFAAILEEEEAAEIASEESTSCFHSLSFSHFCHNKHNCICFSKQSIQMLYQFSWTREGNCTQPGHGISLTWKRMESFNRIQFGRKPGLVKIQLSETLTQVTS